MILGRVALLALALLPGPAARAAEAPPPAAPPPAEAPRPPRRAASVKLILPEHQDNPALEALVTLERGEPVSIPALRRTVTRLFQTGRCRDVVASETEARPPANQGGRWVDLTIECLPLRILTAVGFASEGPLPLGAGQCRS